MASTRTEPSKPKPLSLPEGVVELMPPAETGFSGTAFLNETVDAVLIAELIKRGYTRVSRG